MAEYKHGKMNISAQEKTFASFVTMTKGAVVAIICILIFMALANG